MIVSDVPGIVYITELGFNHPSVVLTADLFLLFINREVTGDTQPLGYVTV